MNTVKVRRDELMKRVEENRGRHRAAVEEAVTNYRKQAIVELDAMLAEAKAGRKIRRAVTLVEPQDHTADYDRVLDMLKMSTDEVIELDSHDFAQYVRDEWEWFGQFAHSNRAYTTTVANTAYLGS